MNKQRRNNEAIVKDILKVIRDTGGSTKVSHLIRKTNLSSELFKNYIGFLKQNQLVREKLNGRNRYFEITERGCEWISTNT